MYFCLQIIFMKVWNPMKLWQWNAIQTNLDDCFFLWNKGEDPKRFEPYIKIYNGVGQ
jgi:hypothetical protein